MHSKEDVLGVPEPLQVSLYIDIHRTALLKDDHMLAKDVGHGKCWFR